MSELFPPPLAKAEIIELLADGACIQPDRHGASVVRVHGRCAEAWEELRREGWLARATNGTLVLSERGQSAIRNLEHRR
jgi:hypothetical protein